MTRRTTAYGLALMVVAWSAAWVITACAQAPEAARATIATEKSAEGPTLTMEQKQAIQILALRMENAQQTAKLAEAAFSAASTELGTLVRSLQREGYNLNLQTLSYAKAAADSKKDETKKKDGSQ